MPHEGLNRFAGKLAQGLGEKGVLSLWGPSPAPARRHLFDFCCQHGERVAPRRGLPKGRGEAIGTKTFDEVAPELDQTPHKHTNESLARLIDKRTNHHAHQEAVLHRLILAEDRMPNAEGVSKSRWIETVADPRVERSEELKRSYDRCRMLLDLIAAALLRLGRKNAAGRKHAIAWLRFLLHGGREPRPNKPLRDSLVGECNERERLGSRDDENVSFYRELHKLFTSTGRGDRRLVHFFENLGEYGREAAFVALAHELHEVGGAQPGDPTT